MRPLYKFSFLFATLSLSLLSFHAEAQSSGTSTYKRPDGGWNLMRPFDQKAFISNYGQYEGKDGKRNSAILYGVNDAGAQMYFNSTGMTFRFDSIRAEVKQEKPGREEKEEGEEREMTFKEYFVRMNWKGATTQKVEVAERTRDYFNFCDPRNEKSSIDFIPGFKKLIYKNLYPNVDAEYTFHEKGGIKYILILHPGADLSKVVMDYSGAKGMYIDGAGNLQIETAMGNIVDHAPYSYFEDGEKVNSRFSLNGNNVSFSIDLTANQQSKIKNQKLIIDPWTVNPNFPQNNKAYDIMKDGNGNIYVFGGKNPYLLKKYDNLGNLIWTYTSAMTGWYGDLAVHPGGDSYITEGYSASNAFGRIAKVNNAGVQQWQQQYNALEFWSLAFNCANTVLTVAGGVGQGKTSTVNLGTGGVTSTITFCPNGETRGMTQAPTGNFYHYCISGANAIYSLTSAAAVVWNTPSGFTNGYGTPSYNNSYSTADAGYNGIGCSNQYVYSINGLTLNQKNITTGATVTTAAIPGGVLTGNGGVFVDACGSVYVGSQTQIHKYGTNMVLASSTAAPGAVYCLANGVGAGDVLACGNTFIASVNIAGICPFNLTINMTTTGGCGSGSGTATASVSGGSGAYTYNWNTGATTTTISNLTSGTYTVNVTDALSCVPFSATVSISSGAGPTATITNSSNATCAQAGSATVSGSGGTGTLTYSWSGSGQSTSTATGLTVGTYTVTVTDQGGCSKTATVNITGTSGPNASVTNIINANCNSTGSATASGTGGTGSYTYSWSSGGQTTQTATGLTAGTYTVTITDNIGCSKSTTVAITGSAGPTASVTNINNANCATTGSATASGTGGTGSYTYSWSAGGQTTQTATGLTSGNYTVIITDNNGCSQSATVNITGAPGPTASVSGSTNATCAAAGNATASAVNGNGSYTYSWSAGAQTTQTATGLSAGTYTVTVTDAFGCTSTATVTITGSAGPSISSVNPTNVLCNGGFTGNATANASGGTGTLTYVWNNGQSTANATGLSAGTYTVVVSDVNGCTSTSTVIITEPPVLNAQALGTVTCSGQLATASVSGAGGTGAYNYLWNNGQAAQTATGLTNGTYTVVITDANSCTASATAQVNANANPSAVFTGIDTAGCEPLCVTFNNATANIVTWSWNFGDGSTGTGATPKHCYTSPGTYSVTLTVTDNNGCTGTFAKNNWIQVYPQTKAAFTAGPQPTTVLNPTIFFTDKSLNATSWNWSFGDILNSTSTLQNPSFNYKDSGCYAVQLIVDNQYTCPDTSDQQVCILGDYELFAPNAFTPDGSGLNDVWNVKGIGIDPNHFKLWIFDRWGNLIFETSDLYQGWNGHAHGGKDIAQQDVYVWKVATRDFLGGKHSYIGHVSLVR